MRNPCFQLSGSAIQSRICLFDPRFDRADAPGTIMRVRMAPEGDDAPRGANVAHRRAYKPQEPYAGIEAIKAGGIIHDRRTTGYSYLWHVLHIVMCFIKSCGGTMEYSYATAR